MTILVTGGSGFLGSHIAGRLLREGDVLSVDDLRAKVDFRPRKCFSLCMDVGNLTRYMIEGSTAIVHTAARADVQYNWHSRSERDKIWDENITATIRLLEVVPDNAPFVFLSTAAVYGDCQWHDEDPHPETEFLEDRACITESPYAASKLACEAIVQSYCEHRKVPWYAFRLGCAVGSGYHHGHIAEFVERAARGPLVARSSGPAKSFVHADDVADAVALVLARRAPSGVYNLHGGLWSARDTVRVMGLSETTTWPEQASAWDGDSITIVSAAKLAAATGWAPTRSVEVGVVEALAGLGWSFP